MALLHVLIPTHLPRYLEFVLIGLARQTRRADSITVSCDTDDPAIGRIIEHWAPKLGLTVWWVRRAPHEGERLCQVRNNGVRHIVDGLGRREGRLITLDGDMLASDTLIEQHERFGRRAPLVYAYRVNLSAQETESLRPEEILSGRQRAPISAQARHELASRHRRYLRHLILRRIALAPHHKPKLLGGHFSCDLDWYLKLNGFDELYQGWGFKDDEFARRAARMGARCVVAVRDIIAWHLHHPTRQQAKMSTLPTSERFNQRDYPLVAEHGVRNPLPQHEVQVSKFE